MKTFSFFSIFFLSVQSMAHVICGDAKIFRPDPEFQHRWDDESSSSIQVARKRLNKKIASSIPAGKTGIFDGKPIQMNKKTISKPDVTSSLNSSTAQQCINSYRGDTGKCEIAAVCVTIEMDYTICKPTKYDENTGKRYAVCPNGKKVEF